MVIGIFTTTGMQLFGGQWPFVDSTKPNQNFDSFPEAYVSAFCVLNILVYFILCRFLFQTIGLRYYITVCRQEILIIGAILQLGFIF